MQYKKDALRKAKCIFIRKLDSTPILKSCKAETPYLQQ